MANLFLMCGVPGSGKSTFLKNYVTIEDGKCVIISRDEIRLSLLKEGEEYFSHEDEVVKIFWEKINNALAAGYDVFVDQTSINPRSRKWLLDHINGYDEVIAIWINTTLRNCIKNNENRKGTNKYAPIDTIINMKEKFVKPSFNEEFSKIYCYNTKTNTLSYKENNKNDNR